MDLEKEKQELIEYIGSLAWQRNQAQERGDMDAVVDLCIRMATQLGYAIGKGFDVREILWALNTEPVEWKYLYKMS